MITSREKAYAYELANAKYSSVTSVSVDEMSNGALEVTVWGSVYDKEYDGANIEFLGVFHRPREEFNRLD